MILDVIIRSAPTDEISRVNSQYDEVAFKHSRIENELIGIAEVNGQRVGLGKLQKIENSVAELESPLLFKNNQCKTRYNSVIA